VIGGAARQKTPGFNGLADFESAILNRRHRAACDVVEGDSDARPDRDL